MIRGPFWQDLTTNDTDDECLISKITFQPLTIVMEEETWPRAGVSFANTERVVRLREDKECMVSGRTVTINMLTTVKDYSFCLTLCVCKCVCVYLSARDRISVRVCVS